MRRLIARLVLPAAAALAGGCASTPDVLTARGQSQAAEFVRSRADEPGVAKDGKTDAGAKKDEEEKPEKKDAGPPKALLKWAVGPEVEEKPEAEDHIVTDRPDFTEASVTVGEGRVQLEAGYTHVRERSAGTTRITEPYPEALLRIGVLSDWLELRLGNTYIHSRTTAFGQTTEHLSGVDDLYVGTKVALTEQKGYLPETATIFQATIPTGSNSLSSGKLLPGFSFLYGWDVIGDFLTVGGSCLANRAIDDAGHSYIEFAKSVTIGYRLTPRVGAYTEWFAFFPASAVAPDVTAQHYFNGGFTFLVTPDFQLDIRAGWGLNHHADDFFAGAGFAVRY